LECNFQRGWFGIVDDGRATSCVIYTLEVSRPLEFVISVKSADESAAANTSDVKGLVILGRRVHYLPSGINKAFQNLEGLYIDYTNFKQITKTNLLPFPKLKELRIIDNDLEAIPSDSFTFNRDLEIIDFSRNNLKHIDVNILEPLIKLREAYFTANTCISFAASDEQQITNLTKLIADNCQDEMIIMKDSQSLNEV